MKALAIRIADEDAAKLDRLKLVLMKHPMISKVDCAKVDCARVDRARVDRAKVDRAKVDCALDSLPRYHILCQEIYDDTVPDARISLGGIA